MTVTARRLALLATTSLLAFAAVACGSSTAPSGSTAPASVAASAPASVEASPAAASPSAVESAGTSAAASAPASAGTSPAGSANIPSFHEAPDLEAALPDQVAGTALQKLSFNGAGALAGGTDSQDFQQLLTTLGKSPADFSLAVAGGANVSVGVFRVAGIDGNVLLNAFIEAAKKGDSATQVTDASRGGKSVKKVATGSETTYAYATGDKVFFVQSSTDALVDEALSKLP
jgi:hypothetical protein